MKQKLKITFEVSQRIKVLKGELPKTPRFNDGIIMTKPVQKTVSGKDLIKEGVTEVQGSKVNPGANYIQKAREPIYMNHEVGLTEAYRKDGEQGLLDYKAEVEYIQGEMKATEERRIQREAVKNIPKD